MIYLTPDTSSGEADISAATQSLAIGGPLEVDAEAVNPYSRISESAGSCDDQNELSEDFGEAAEIFTVDWRALEQIGAWEKALPPLPLATGTLPSVNQSSYLEFGSSRKRKKSELSCDAEIESLLKLSESSERRLPPKSGLWKAAGKVPQYDTKLSSNNPSTNRQRRNMTRSLPFCPAVISGSLSEIEGSTLDAPQRKAIPGDHPSQSKVLSAVHPLVLGDDALTMSQDFPVAELQDAENTVGERCNMRLCSSGTLFSSPCAKPLPIAIDNSKFGLELEPEELQSSTNCSEKEHQVSSIAANSNKGFEGLGIREGVCNFIRDLDDDYEVYLATVEPERISPKTYSALPAISTWEFQWPECFLASSLTTTYTDPTLDDSESETTYACSERAQLFSHQAVVEGHTGLTSHKSFACPYEDCGLRYRRRDTYQRHVSTHLSTVRFECSHCHKRGVSKAFKRKDHLRQHIRQYHNISLAVLNSGYFYCTHSQCQLSEALHQALSPGQKAFESKKEWSYHMRMKHGESAFSCDVPGCERVGKKGYARETDLRIHKKKKHGITCEVNIS